MIKIKDIEKEVSRLPAKDFATFRGWFHKYDASKWDKQFDDDVRSGKLDRFARKAAEDLKKGKCKAL